MTKVYLTFGQIHVHRVNGKTFDCDCVAVIDCDSHEHGREIAFNLFSDKWFTTYLKENFDMDDMKYYPRGLINVSQTSVQHANTLSNMEE